MRDLILVMQIDSYTQLDSSRHYKDAKQLVNGIEIVGNLRDKPPKTKYFMFFIVIRRFRIIKINF